MPTNTVVYDLDRALAPAEEGAEQPFQSLYTTDVEAMVRLVGDVCDPALDMSIADRRGRLAQGLAHLVGGDAWFGCIGCTKPDEPAACMVLSLYDGGWRDERQRMGVLGFCLNFERAAGVNRITMRCLDDMQVHVNTRPMYIKDADWSPSALRAEWNSWGFDEFLISVFPMQNLVHSAIGIYRQVGQPAFSARERNIVHIVWQQTEWLHRQDTEYPVGDAPCDLSLRERQVLILLLGGAQRKGFATALDLSEHTVGDYVKAIYRKLGVNSRAQLLAKFLPARRDMTVG